MEDKEIVALYWARDEKAIQETALKYGSYCTAVAMHILENREDAEECVNDAYLSAWNAIPPHKPALLSTFLGKIVRNLSFNRYQQKHAQKRGGGEIAVILDELSEILPDREAVEEQVIRKELLRAIEDFLRTLPEDRRCMFLRRYWYSDSIGDIAAQCGRTENAVSVTLNRIRSRLRAYLTERGLIE